MVNMLVLPAVVLAFCTSIVSLGGLAALQDDCNDNSLVNAATQLVNGFNAGEVALCKKIYEFYWFIVIFEVLLVLATLGCALTNSLRNMRLALLGLLAVATVLYINMTDTFNGARQLPYYRDGNRLDKTRTMLAGSLMTSVANAFLIIALGMEDAEDKVTLPPMARV